VLQGFGDLRLRRKQRRGDADGRNDAFLQLGRCGGIGKIPAAGNEKQIGCATFEPPAENRVAGDVPLGSLPGALVTAVVVPVVLLGLFWSGLYACAQLAGSFAS
jgi:hypothetical protein